MSYYRFKGDDRTLALAPLLTARSRPARAVPVSRGGPPSHPYRQGAGSTELLLLLFL